MEKELSQTFFLSAGETNAEREMSLPLLTSKIIDIATAHANSLGIGNPSMAARGCGWVLSRIAIEMETYPQVNEYYTITTWIENWNRHFSERCFMITGADGKTHGYARSIWMVLDTTSRESVGLSHLNLPEGMTSERVCPIPKQGKHQVILPCDTKAETLPRGAVISTAPGVEYIFKYTDLDFYRHVNTVRYVSLLLNQFGLEHFDSNRVERMEMAFMREGRYNEKVEVRRADTDNASLFSIVDSESDTPLLFSSIRFAGR